MESGACHKKTLVCSYVLMISETNLDGTFPIDKFILQGFNKPFRNDRNINGGDILLFIRKDIPVIITFMRKSAIGSGTVIVPPVGFPLITQKQ